MRFRVGGELREVRTRRLVPIGPTLLSGEADQVDVVEIERRLHRVLVIGVVAETHQEVRGATELGSDGRGFALSGGDDGRSGTAAARHRCASMATGGHARAAPPVVPLELLVPPVPVAPLVVPVPGSTTASSWLLSLTTPSPQATARSKEDRKAGARCAE